MEFPYPGPAGACSKPSSGQQLKGVDVAGTHGREVSVIQGRELRLAEPLDDGEHGTVHEPDPEVLVRPHQRGGARMVGRGEVFDVELAAGDRVQKSRELVCS